MTDDLDPSDAPGPAAEPDVAGPPPAAPLAASPTPDVDRPAGVPPWQRGGTRPASPFATPGVPGAVPPTAAPQHPFGAVPPPGTPGSPFAAPVAPATPVPGVVGPGVPGAGPGSPSAVTADHLSASAGWATEARPGAAPPLEYAQLATSPLWWLLATIGLSVVGFVVWVVAFGAVLSTSDGEALSDGASTGLTFGSIVAFVLLLAAWICSLIWVYTIGQNAGTFGLGLMLAAMFPIYLFPLLFAGPIPLFLGTFLWAAFPVRMLITGVWLAGRLPRAIAAVAWGPLVLGYGCMLVAVIIAVDQARRTYGDFDGTAAVVWVVGSLLTSLGGFAYLGFLIAVTIIQHLGIGRDRRLRAEARELRRRQQGFA